MTEIEWNDLQGSRGNRLRFFFTDGVVVTAELVSIDSEHTGSEIILDHIVLEEGSSLVSTDVAWAVDAADLKNWELLG